MNSTFLKGRRGEQRAREYLEKLGYKIMESNYRFQGNEVDIIARVGDTLCFLEVKSWQTVPEEDLVRAIGPVKRRRIIKAARGYLAQSHPQEAPRVRFDVIFMDGVEGALRHYESAFDASE